MKYLTLLTAVLLTAATVNAENLFQSNNPFPQTAPQSMNNIYETEPQNLNNQPYFLNCAIKIKTSLSPLKLLETCQQIESTIGRNQTIRFGPRNIDIDILTYNEDEITLPKLTIPHPRMFERNFVL